MKKQYSLNSLMSTSKEVKRLETKISLLATTRSKRLKARCVLLKKKIVRMLKSLRLTYSARTLRRAMGSLALSFGLFFSPSVKAQSYAGEVINPFGLSWTNEDIGFMVPVDIDGDGDYDIFGGDEDGNSIHIENIGDAENPSFSSLELNLFGIVPDTFNYLYPVIADFDGDGDFDVLNTLGSGEITADTFINGMDTIIIESRKVETSYFENIGTPNSPEFAAPEPNPFGFFEGQNLGFMIPTVADVDNDGDYDLLGHYYIENQNFIEVGFWENVGNPQNPVFAEVVNSPFNIEMPLNETFGSFSFSDLDNDGDLDLLYADYEYGQRFYFENIGSAENPNFDEAVPQPFGLGGSYYTYSAHFVDFDADGDQDVLDLGYGYNEEYLKFFYFENIGGVASDQETLSSLNVFPNPTKGIVAIESEDEIADVLVLDSKGKKVFFIERPSTSLELDLDSGIYMIEITSTDGKRSIEKLVFSK